MDEFVTTLKSIYRERQLFTEDQWLRISGDKLINLQLVEGDKREGFYAKQSTVKRTRIVSENLFNGERVVKKVSVEGNGGMGKTTLCTMITEGWAKEKMLTQFEYLFFLPLREEDFASAQSLSDLLKLLHPSENICTSVVSNLEHRVGKGLLIVADGWDELSESKRCKSSFLYKLLFGRVLPFASVLLTSRPSASADLRKLPCVDRLVEVVGFTEDNIIEYIECEFEKCPEKAYGLIEQLTNNPLIKSLCSVPLNCAITCSLWRTLDQQLPTTLTELYTLIILNVILRNINKLSDLQNVSTLKSFDSIPSQLQPYWWLTCKFAFETLSKDQLVFTEEEVASLLPEGFESSQQLLYFGLLQSTHSLLPVGHGLSFHFLHLTFQEYLAALHLVTLPSEEQMTVVKKYLRMGQFRMVWRFFFGLGADKHSHYTGYVSKKVICLDEKVIQIVLSLKFSFFEEINKRLQSDCALESRNDIVSCKIAQNLGNSTPSCRNPYDYIATLHVLSHTSNCDSIYLNMRSCGLTDKLLDRLTDILSAAHGKLNVCKLHLDNNKLTGRGISDLFNKASVAFNSFVEISLSNNSLHGDCVDSIVSSLIHTSCKSLSRLTLSNNPLGVSGIQALERAAVAGVLVNLECLHLANTFSSDADINGALLTIFLASLSSHCSRLYDLDLSENNLGVPGVCALGEALAQLIVRTSFSLTLRNTMLDCEAISAFTDCLERSSNLTSTKFLIHHNGSQCKSESLSTMPKEYSLNLDDNPLNYSGALVMLRLLSNETFLITNLSLRKIGISNVTKSNSLVDIFEPATNNHSLTRLDLSKNNLSGEGVHLIVKFMNVCKSLEDLDCSYCKLTSKDIYAWCEALPLLTVRKSTISCKPLIHHNGNQSQSSILPKEYHLNLSNNPLKYSGALVVLRLLSNETCLITDLTLSNIMISNVTKSDSLVDMFEAATNNYSLRRLYFSQNNLSGEGVHLIVNFMNVCKSLKYLDCYSCKLTSKDVCTLCEALPLLSDRKSTISGKPLIHHNGSQSRSISLSVLPKEYHLDLSNNPLNYSGALVMLRLLNNETCLITDLSLINIDISNVTKSDSLVDMFEPATNNYSLTDLNLSKNNLSGEGVHLIVKFMNVCKSLKHVDCSDCKLTSKDIYALCETLPLLTVRKSTISCKSSIHQNGSQPRSRSPSTLAKKYYNFNLNDNPLNYSGALVVLRLLSNETCLITDLRLSNIDMTNVTKSDSLVGMFEPATNNYSLTDLGLSRNNLSGEGVYLIVKFMNVCKSLQQFDCGNCKLTSQYYSTNYFTFEFYILH